MHGRGSLFVRGSGAALVGVLVLLAVPAFAQDDEAYRDDRSDAVALVQSLYNAINRQEFLRAWSYFDEVAKPGAPEAFAEGYADTERVTVHPGEPQTEGAAGTLYTRLPVVIEAVTTDGASTVYAGCYITRLAQPANQQTPPIMPLHIVAAELEPVGTEASAASGSCEGVEIE